MSLVLNQDQRQIQESARRFFSQSAPVASFRKLRDTKDPRGYSLDTWKQMVELGFAAASIPESCGGLGLGFVALGCILEEAGRRLCASPLLATAVLGAAAVELAGSPDQRQSILGAIAADGLSLALALEESPHHAPDNIRCTASETASGYVINGEKRFVIDGHTADKLIIVAVEENDPGRSPAFFVIDRDAQGLSCSALHMVDSRSSAHLVLRNVSVNRSQRLSADDGRAVLNGILDRSRACLAAEMLGSIDELFERSVAYLREREQFGVKIGSFQALKHRAARLYAEIELTRSSVIAALSALDSKAADASLLCCLAKARANDAIRLASNEAVQMHGGIGITDELDIGLFLKRSRVAIQSFGDSPYLRRRYATLSAY